MAGFVPAPISPRTHLLKHCMCRSESVINTLTVYVIETGEMDYVEGAFKFGGDTYAIAHRFIDSVRFKTTIFHFSESENLMHELQHST